MASKYLQKYPVPPGFQQILADLTREVLRDQPPNIIEYASKYFELMEKGDKVEFNSKYNVSKQEKKYELAYNPKSAQQITKKATSIAKKVSPVAQKGQKVPPEILSSVNKIFDQIDINGNGYIESIQIRKAISILANQYGINQYDIKEEDIREFVRNLDRNCDGRVSRLEFLDFVGEMLAPLLDGIRGRVPGSEKSVNQQEVDNFMDQQAQSAIQEQLMSKFEQIFNEVDTDHSGFITSNEIRKIGEMFAAETGAEDIDENELQEFVDAVDTNNDGKISKRELFDFFMSLFANR